MLTVVGFLLPILGFRFRTFIEIPFLCYLSMCSLPFDFVKTRIQKMKPLPDGSMPYRNALDCARKVLHGLTVEAVNASWVLV